jgi:hypothetical protein
MQNDAMQAALRPYVKLVQSNMELLSRYSMSPEAMTKAIAQAQSLFTPGQNTTPPQLAQLAQWPGFAELAQGMIKNYTEFMAEVAQSSTELLAQGQANFIQQTQQATGGAAGAAGTRSRAR